MTCPYSIRRFSGVVFTGHVEDADGSPDASKPPRRAARGSERHRRNFKQKDCRPHH